MITKLHDKKLFVRLVKNTDFVLGGKGLNALLSFDYIPLTVGSLGTYQVGVLLLFHAYTVAIFDVLQFETWQTVLHYGSPILKTGNARRLQHILSFSLGLDIASTLFACLIGFVSTSFFLDFVYLTRDTWIYCHFTLHPFYG